MSLNAYFTYSIVIQRGVPWQTALGVVLLSGMLFLILTLTNIREQIVNGIPDCLKHGTAAGIGLFIAFVGFRNAGIIVANPSTFVALGKTSNPQVFLAAVGVLVIAILMAQRVGSAILIGIVIDHAAGHSLRSQPLAGAYLFVAASVGNIFEARPALGYEARARRAGFCVLLRGSLRQRRHARRRVRAGRISAGRQTAAREPRSAGGRLRHDRRRADGHVHGYQLYRKRGGSSGGSAHRPRKSGDRGVIRRGDVLRTACRGDSFVRHGARADLGRRADVRLGAKS